LYIGDTIGAAFAYIRGAMSAANAEEPSASADSAIEPSRNFFIDILQ
jgi:hypothetical protein